MAPLDWGLGHATRCIPIIHELLFLGCEVFIGAENKQAALLKEEFPKLSLLPLPGYGIQYSARASAFGIKMIRQLPRIRQSVHREHNWLKKMVARHRIDAVISDNRLGLYHTDIPCVIMTHQLRIKSPFGRMTERWLQKVNYHYIQKFDICWVVDFEGRENLAGELSHPERIPKKIPVKYIGGLSRFNFQEVNEAKYDLLALISGPEPQRTLFEQMILEQIKATDWNALVVSGQPGLPSDKKVTKNIRVINHLNSRALNEAILQSRLVICRSGYTSVMDLIRLRKNAILIPTPGQTEQEYLGNYLMQKGYFISVSQERFNLKRAIVEAGQFAPHFPAEIQINKYKEIVKDFVSSIYRSGI